MAYKIRNLIQELQSIEQACGVGGDSKERDSDLKLNSFAAAERDLRNLVKEIRHGVATFADVSSRVGRNEDTVRLKHANQKLLDSAIRKWNEMSKSVTRDEERIKQNKKKKLAQEELDARKEILSLFESEINELKSRIQSPAASRAGAKPTMNLARDLRDQRAKQRRARRGDNNGGNGIEVDDLGPAVPLSQAQQQFMKEADQRDEVLDSKLDLIHARLKEVNTMAHDIHTELTVQETMLADVEAHVDKTSDKLASSNARLQLLLKQSGGLSRWCPIIIAVCILLALGAYIIKLV